MTARDQSLVDVVVVGAGITGLYAIHKYTRDGLRVVAIEAEAELGGTWWRNSYPGARVDISGVEFSYSFDEQLQQDWTWSRRYPYQPEVLAYLRHVAERFDLRRHIRFDTRVVGATFDEARSRWSVETNHGATISARYLVLATGILSAPKADEMPGIETFAGQRLIPAEWPKEPLQLEGKRVGVIGTGSTGVQIITALAPRLKDHLYVFQRSAPYVVPAWNHPLTPDHVERIKSDYPAMRAAGLLDFASYVGYFDGFAERNRRSALDVSPAERDAEFERRWREGGLFFFFSFTDLMTDDDANAHLADFLKRKIREQIGDHALAAKLMPGKFQPMSRRLCVEDGYYQSYTTHHANLVDIDEHPIVSVTPEGIMTDAGLVELDVIITAVGFEAVTGSHVRIAITGRAGRTLAEAWANEPTNYVGIMVEDFPNMFVLNGLGSPGALALPHIVGQLQVDWTSELISHCAARGTCAVQPSGAAVRAWTEHLTAAMEETVVARNGGNWYTGTNVPGARPKPLLYFAGYPRYAGHVRGEAESGFPNLVFDGDDADVEAHRERISAVEDRA